MTGTEATIQLARSSSLEECEVLSVKSGGAHAVFATEASVIGNTIYNGGAGDGIVLQGDGAQAHRNKVRGTGAGKNAIRCTATATNAVARDNSLGTTGARTAADTILDENPTGNNQTSGNITLSTLPRLRSASATTHTGTIAETTLLTQAFTAGTVQVGQGWRVRLSGTTTGTAGAKTLRIKLNANTALTLVVAGDWSIEGSLTARGSNAGFAYRFITHDGTATVVKTGSNAVSRTIAASVNLTAQCAVNTDAITVYEYDIEPFREGSVR